MYTMVYFSLCSLTHTRWESLVFSSSIQVFYLHSNWQLIHFNVKWNLNSRFFFFNLPFSLSRGGVCMLRHMCGSFACRRGATVSAALCFLLHPCWITFLCFVFWSLCVIFSRFYTCVHSLCTPTDFLWKTNFFADHCLLWWGMETRMCARK